ncbi:MAG: ubiquitin-activating E1 FCCH domain-containing protein [Phycisphaerae bacterium]|nr:ubiquitin-activating E1 FCCH domain-containing protein [Phycisphaerae bacterium]
MGETALYAGPFLGSFPPSTRLPFGLAARGAAGSEDLPASWQDKLAVVRLYPAATESILAISKAGAAVVQVGAPSAFAIGDFILFANVQGMVEINGLWGEITNVTGDTITVAIDSSGFTPYTTGGSVALCDPNVKATSGMPDAEVAAGYIDLTPKGAPRDAFYVSGGQYALIGLILTIGGNPHSAALASFSVEGAATQLATADAALLAAAATAAALTTVEGKVDLAATAAALAVTDGKVDLAATAAALAVTDGKVDLAATAAALAVTDGKVDLAATAAALAVTDGKVDLAATAAALAVTDGKVDTIVTDAGTAATQATAAAADAASALAALGTTLAANPATAGIAPASFHADMLNYLIDVVALHTSAYDHYAVVFHNALTAAWKKTGVVAPTITVTTSAGVALLTTEALAETGAGSGLWALEITDSGEQIPAGVTLFIDWAATIDGTPYTGARVVTPKR